MLGARRVGVMNRGGREEATAKRGRTDARVAYELRRDGPRTQSGPSGREGLTERAETLGARDAHINLADTPRRTAADIKRLTGRASVGRIRFFPLTIVFFLASLWKTYVSRGLLVTTVPEEIRLRSRIGRASDSDACAYDGVGFS